MQSTQDVADKTCAKFVASFQDNLVMLRRVLRVPLNKDCVVREFRIGEVRAAVLYVEGLTNRTTVERCVLEPCMYHAWNLPDEPQERTDFLMERVISVYDIKSTDAIDEAVQGILGGKALLMVEGCVDGLMLETRGISRRNVDKTTNEAVILGPQEGFVENLRSNLALVRAGVRSPRLVTEMLMLGNEIPTQCAVMYLDGVAEDGIVQEVLRRIRGVAADYVPGIGHLEQLIEDHPFSLFPQICTTERPDRACSFLVAGQVLVFVDGSPHAMAMPITMLHLIHTPDDNYMRWQNGTFVRLVRMLGMYVGTWLPAIYVALMVHHPQAIPIVLLSSIYDAQARMPLPILLEALVLLGSFHLINEAAARVPGSMGSSLGVVSALILGQAAVAADLVSPLMLIVIAVSGVGTFVIPDYLLNIAIKLRQLLFLVVANFFGLYGVLLLFLLLNSKMGVMTSLGSPYLAPLTPHRPHNYDVFLRLPIWMQRLRGFFADPHHIVRSRGRLRAWDKRRQQP